ncbi:SusE domain-containing protein [Ferruginibacter albus]|uniref:SusE domain-containing protein n=1 Tax=Ferruginibacter albus TaxID=2875540 RepID=UPI001CC3BE13|nr:SusE domain-containing protein [Ferruginibacter albus]UAY51872.1 SusE domain-containing protein [Ferruginibacter albus]
MHKFLKITALLCSVYFGLLSCNKEGEQFNVQQGSFADGALSATQTTVVLSAANDSDTVLTLNCIRADYGKQPAVTYTLQMDLAKDTSNKWQKAVSYSLDATTMQYNFLGMDLNAALKKLGAPANTESPIAFRIIAEVRTNNNSATDLGTVYTNTLVINATPYVTVSNSVLYVPGGYQNWDPATAPTIAEVAGLPGKYEGYIYITGADKFFKYTDAPDWNHTNYGAAPNNTFSTDGNAAGLSVPEEGYYEVTADLGLNTWTATKTTWSIIGDASPGNWTVDTDMSYDPANQVWTSTLFMKQGGSFKFRANHDWKIDFGIDGSNNMVYVDNPFLPYNPQNNMTVPADGTYTITLDLHVSQKYKYTIVKN